MGTDQKLDTISDIAPKILEQLEEENQNAKKYVCLDKNRTRVYEGDKFRVVNSQTIDPLDECQFYWNEGLLRFGMKVKHLNPKWASCGLTTASMGQPWCYTNEAIEKI